jgi:pyridoxamine 5'-phosphate oxidase
MPLTPDQLAALRQDYTLRGLRRADLDADPFRQFHHWLADAVQAVPEPNAMVLSTVDGAGQPWSRTVLLKVCDERGFTFFTNYEGAKGQHLATNPRAALTFWWSAVQRQVNIAGVVEKTSAAESDEYFRTRPEASRLSAWASQQSSVLPDRAELERRVEEARAQFGTEDISCPPHWGGYRLVPHTIEFWQGRQSRLHDRFRFTREDGAWRIDRLSP